jgi:8-oxo-dGTP pyrophosphatase MutT (NUDIX family)
VRAPVPTWCFAIVIVRRRADEFLLVHEAKHGQGWYFPAGRVEPGETFEAGAHRETLEEAGLPIVLEGILRVEHTPQQDGTARCRVFYVARPAGDTPPKSQPDEHSLEARWVRRSALGDYVLRGREVTTVIDHVARGGVIAPLSLLTVEDTAWP